MTNDNQKNFHNFITNRMYIMPARFSVERSPPAAFYNPSQP
ncbi:hypothetical protein [Nostoc piscinale]|nr:hypothetical protein [Nostoc piscinale]